jgi:hypothetical protein
VGGTAHYLKSGEVAKRPHACKHHSHLDASPLDLHWDESGESKVDHLNGKYLYEAPIVFQ